ncbi:Kelch-like protein 29, partial [Dissostichus eleginoides]
MFQFNRLDTAAPWFGSSIQHHYDGNPEQIHFTFRCQSVVMEKRYLYTVSGLSPGDNQTPGLLLAPGVRWGQTPINQLTPWDTDEPPAKQHRDSEPTGPAWATSVAAVSQPSLLPHTYALAQPPSFNHSVTAQSPIIGPPSMVLNMPGQPPYPSIPSALAAQANHVVHPNSHSLMGNGHLTSHPGLLQHPALPLTNGQAAAAHAQATAGDNQDGPNGVQMLRTVGMGKYEFSDPGHPKGPERSRGAPKAS